MRIFNEQAENYIAKLASAVHVDPASLESWRCMHIALKPHDDSKVAAIPDQSIMNCLRDSYKDVDCDIILCRDGDMLLITEDLDALSMHNLAASLTSSFCDIMPDVTLYHLFKDWREIHALLFSKATPMEAFSEENALPSDTHPHSFGDVSSLAEVFDAAKTLRKARKPQHILIVEDDPLTRRVVANAFKGDYALITAETATEAIENYLLYAPDIVFLDIGLPDASGFDVLKQIIKSDPDAYVVMFSGNSYLDNVTNALTHGAAGFIAKPFKKEKMHYYIDDSALHHQKKSV